MTSKLLRYPDLVERQIVNNRTTLGRWIRDYDFPRGILLGPNTRAWDAQEIEAWIQKRSNESPAA